MTKPYSQSQWDVLVVGSGIAGLSFALRLAQSGFSVGIITKKNQAESNTNYAQGGIASVTSIEDDFSSHIADTLEAGAGLCQESKVQAIVEGGPAAIKELIEVGVNFSKESEDAFSLGQEGGHSHRRILHVQDATGKAIEQALLREITANPLITVWEHWLAIDLITRRRLAKSQNVAIPEADAVLGLYALNVRSGKVCTLLAKGVLLATGGVGQVYQYTTNPCIATGDGIAMAYRAGVSIANMEFIQFHPTTLYSQSNKRFLISEAVRGEGAILRKITGEKLMEGYHPKQDLAPRDIVARAIDDQMKESGAAHVWLDMTSHSKTQLQQRFPSIYQNCLVEGIDMASQWIPVVPAAHYLCGGIQADIDGSTALPGLYACGEVACTGLHGANRLASNSLLEAVVVAQKAAIAVAHYLKTVDTSKKNLVPIPEWTTGEFNDRDERVVLMHNREELKRVLWDYVGIVRTTKRLKRALTRISLLEQEVNEYYWNFQVDAGLLELRNLIQTADLIVRCALKRRESRGLHYTLDFPQTDSIAKDTVIDRDQ